MSGDMQMQGRPSPPSNVQDAVFTLLEFNKLLAVISMHTHGEASKKAVEEIRPFTGRQEIESRQNMVREIMRGSQEGFPLGLSHFPDIAKALAKVRPEGSILDPHELSGFVPVFEISALVSSQIRERSSVPFLTELISVLTGFPEIRRILKRSVDTEGNILDTASASLSDIREQIRRLDARIRKKLEELVRNDAVAIFLQDDFITKRSGRWVIPVRMDSKGQVSGVVHDVSNSGETAFVEPLAIIHLANELENLVAEEKAEEIRILRSISAMLRNAADAIQEEYRVLIHLDLLNSIAAFALKLDMEIPSINDSGAIRLVRARHPLLLLSFRKADSLREVVPLDVSLGGDSTIMVITGSNAGGKTIAIKTTGLLLLMALSGIPVPADSSSSFPLISGLLVDIGDEQSIESSLSTFSAHISNISRILRSSDDRTVVLIDELGTGTDPDEGAALACAVLQELRNSKALVFATTHLADIKGFVHRTEGMLNASMEFDQVSLTPLYRLRIGEPGRSHALETARRYGLPESVIDSARAMLGGIKVEFDNLIADLEQKRTDYERGLDALRKEKTALEERSRLAEARLDEAERTSREKLSTAYAEAALIITETKRQMNAHLEDLKKKDRASAREALRKVETIQKELSEKAREHVMDDPGRISIEEILQGDTVFVRSFGYDATVVKVTKKDGRIRVRAGNKEIEVPLEDLGRKQGRSMDSQTGSVHIDSPDGVPISRISLVGMRVDEALSMLEPFLNHASLSGLTEVTIIHGIGTGQLSRAVREHLTGHPLVRHFRGGDRTEGGEGVTLATLS